MRLAKAVDAMSESKRSHVSVLPLREALRVIAGGDNKHSGWTVPNEEWFTPAPIIARTRLVLGSIDLDPASCAQAQKVEVGYDKSVNFEKYKTYSWAEAATPPARPMLYQTVVGWIDGDLNSKGFQRVDKDGDAMTRRRGDVFGQAENVKVGTRNIVISLDKVQVEDQTLGGGGAIMGQAEPEGHP